MKNMKGKSIKPRMIMRQIAVKDSIFSNISKQLGRGYKWNMFINFGNNMLVTEEANVEMHTILSIENYKKKL
jgi:hypothetical protein